MNRLSAVAHSVGLLWGLSVVAATAALAADAADAEAAGPGEGRFFALDVLQTQEAERLLSDAADAGFGLLEARKGFRSGWTRGGYAALLERSGPDDRRPVAYRVLAHTHLSRLEQALNDAASEGFQLLPEGLFFQQRGTAPFQDPEFVAIVGRFPGQAVQRHYLVPEAQDLTEPIRIAVQRGYEAVGFTAGPESAAVVLEIHFRGDRPADDSPAEDRYRLLEAGRLGSMRAMIRDAPSQGYRLLGVASAAGRIRALLVRDPEAAAMEYFLPGTKRFLEELRSAAAEGFRLVPGTLANVPVLARPRAAPVAYEYDVVGLVTESPETDEPVAPEDEWKRTSRAEKKGELASPADWLVELEARAAAGWSVRGLLGPTAALLERPRP